MKYLTGFLNEVAQYSSHNKMDAKNLAACFGPSLFNITYSNDIHAEIERQNRLNCFVEILIKHNSDFFEQIIA